jgi:hypothetical protein
MNRQSLSNLGKAALATAIGAVAFAGITGACAQSYTDDHSMRALADLGAARQMLEQGPTTDDKTEAIADLNSAIDRIRDGSGIYDPDATSQPVVDVDLAGADRYQRVTSLLNNAQWNVNFGHNPLAKYTWRANATAFIDEARTSAQDAFRSDTYEPSVADAHDGVVRAVAQLHMAELLLNFPDRNNMTFRERDAISNVQDAVSSTQDGGFREAEGSYSYHITATSGNDHDRLSQAQTLISEARDSIQAYEDKQGPNDSLDTAVSDSNKALRSVNDALNLE